MTNNITADDIADVIMEKPDIIKVGNRIFTMYPITLGKSLLLGKLYESMNIDNNLLQKDPTLECLRLASEYKETACRVIAYVSMSTKRQIFNVSKVHEKIQYLKTNTTTDDIATLLLYIFSMATTEEIQRFYEIDKEKERTAKILACKEPSKNSISVGGKSIYGTLIDEACSRYGWTLDYVVWGISLANLHTMLADRITSIHLTDKEAKKCKVSTDNIIVKADDPKNKNFLKRLFQD